MKKLIITATIAILGSTFVYANPFLPKDNLGKKEDKAKKNYFEVGMYRITNSNLVNVFVEKVLGSNVFIIVKNDNGEVFAQQHLEKGSTVSKSQFNFREVPDGEYTIDVSGGNKTVSKRIKIFTETLQERRFEIK